MTIALLCPTRGRPVQCRRMIESVFETAHKPFDIEIHLYVADDDPEMDAYNELAKSFGHDDDVFWHHGIDYPTVYKWNLLASEAKASLYMLASDDMIFATPDWDKELLYHYNALENKVHVYHLQDSRDAEGTPHPIVTREWITTLGYFLNPIFFHWFSDTWAVEVAKANDCFTHLRSFSLVHAKPSDRGMTDETHNRIRRMGWHERDKYVNDTCQHYLELEKRRLAKALQ